MNLQRGEIIFLIMLFLITAAAGIWLYFDFTRRIKTGDAEVVGTLIMKRNTAERRYSNQVVWESLANSFPLYNKDTIRTGSASEAQIVLKDGTRIDIEENSMIVLNIKSSQEASIEFAYGSLQAQSASKGALSIISGDTVVSLNDSDVKLSGGKEENLNVVVSRGEAELTSGGQKQKIGENQIASLSEEGLEVTKLSLRPQSPADGARIFIKEQRAEVPFRISGTDQARPAHIEISPSRTFSREVIRSEFTGSSVSVALKPGVYYWRASQFDPAAGKNETTAVYRFSLLSNSPVEAVLPVADAELQSMSDEMFVNFVWKQHDLASAYVLEIASDPDFANPVNRIETQTTSIATKLKQGTYYWKITTRSVIPEGVSTGPVRRLTVTRLREMPPPVLLRPVSGQTLPVQLLSGQGITLQWNEDIGTDTTEIQISRDPSFSKGNTITKTSRTGYLILRDELSTGTWYWRARSLAADGTASRFTSDHSFGITSDPVQIRIISPAESGKISRSGIMERGLLFSWESAVSGPETLNEFILSRNRGLTDTVEVRRDFKGSSLHIPAPANGEYFWQVRIYDSAKTLIARSEISSFSVISELKEPVAVFPVSDSLVNMATRDDLPFRWEGTADATGYVFTLYRIENRMRRPILQRNLTVRNFILTDLSLLDVGDFAWSVKAQRKEGNQLTESREVITHFRISLGDAKVPEILSPQIQYIEKPGSAK